MTPAILLLLALVVLIAGAALARAREVTTVYPPMVGLLYRNGKFERELPPGRYAWFDPLRRRKVVMVALAGLPVQLGEITVLSRDQFSFRLGLAPVLNIVDARRFAESQSLIEQSAFAPYVPMASSHAALHSLVAAAAIGVAGGYTLAEILAAPAAVPEGLRAKLADAVPGAVVEQVLLTAINLPPETRKMFTDVERAKMEAQAALERARGEQAALRVLANAARLVADNPALANLRLLQAVESSKGATTIIIGNAAAPLPGLGAQEPPSGKGRA
jgi:regulator of protease activity HflC (stomatin/prohibitin superfamily)